MLKRLAPLALVTALLALPANAGSSVTAVAACGTAGAVNVPLGPSYSSGYQSIAIEIKGTWVGTLNFKVAQSTTFVSFAVSPFPAGASTSTTAANGQWVGSVTGASTVCVESSAWTSGSADVTMTPMTALYEPPFTDVPIGNTGAGVYGTSTAPGAGGAIATFAAPGVGFYDATVSIALGTGSAAADANNFALKVGGTTIQQLLIPLTANGPPVVYSFRRISVPAATAVTVNAVGAGTATVPYYATISLIPVN